MLLIQIKPCDIESVRRQQVAEADVAILHLILVSELRVIRSLVDYYQRQLAAVALSLCRAGLSQHNAALLNAAKARVDESLAEQDAADMATAALEVAA